MEAEVTGGQVSDYRGYDAVMDDDLPQPRVLMADRGYDSDHIREDVEERAGRVGKTGAVHAFEPSPRLAPYLSATLAENPDLNIKHHRVALGIERTLLPLHIPAGNAGAATLRPAGATSTADAFEVQVHPLSDYAEEVGIDRVDFVKIDVEGFEEKVILGAVALFERCPPKAIVLEEHARVTPESLPNSLATLRQLDYDLYALPKRLFRLELVPIDHPEAAAAHDYVAIFQKDTGETRKRLRV